MVKSAVFTPGNEAAKNTDASFPENLSSEKAMPSHKSMQKFRHESLRSF
jgi:hypothetical protein